MNRKVIIGFLLILIFFAAAGYAQQVEPSIPLKIAHQYRNDIKFEDALEWYEKVINDFPETQAAAEACLNRIAILQSQSGTYAILVQNFGLLMRVKDEEASNYISSKLRLEAISKGGEFYKKSNDYLVKVAQIGRKLREEFYRFEKNYARFIEELPMPWLPLKAEEIHADITLSVESARRILALGLVSDLDSESRIKIGRKLNFSVFCFRYLASDGEFGDFDSLVQWSSGKYTGKINQAGFYHWLGITLYNSGQFKAALLAFDKVLDLTSDSPYNKLRYESEKKKKELLSMWKEYLATMPAEAQEFAEKLEE